MSLFPSAGIFLDFLGAVLVVALGALVLRVRPRRRTTLLLGLFIVGFGMRNVLVNLTAPPDPGNEPLFVAGEAFALVTVPALVLLALRVPRPLDSGHRHLAAAAAVVAVGFTAAWLGILGDLFGAYARQGSWRPAFVTAAALLGTSAVFFALALFALRFPSTEGAGERRGLALMSAALALQPFLGLGGNVLATGFTRHLGILGAAVALLLAGLWIRNTRTEGGRDARTVALLFPALVVGGMLARVVAGGQGVPVSDSGLFGMARLVTVSLLAYAILRHQLLGLDVKVKWTVKQSTLAAAFVGVFFVVSESAATFFSGSGLGPYLGIAAAGMLVFAIAPLQRAAERVASAAMPGVKDLGKLGHDDRLALYREQLRAAWADGVLSADERRMLGIARERLAITDAEAMRCEREVAPP